MSCHAGPGPQARNLVISNQVTNLTCEDEQTLHLEWITALPDTQVQNCRFSSIFSSIGFLAFVFHHLSFQHLHIFVKQLICIHYRSLIFSVLYIIVNCCIVYRDLCVNFATYENNTPFHLFCTKVFILHLVLAVCIGFHC